MIVKAPGPDLFGLIEATSNDAPVWARGAADAASAAIVNAATPFIMMMKIMR